MSNWNKKSLTVSTLHFVTIGINCSRPEHFITQSTSFIQCNRVFSSQIKVIAESNDAIIAFQTQRGPIHFRAALKFLFESAIVVITSHFLIFQPHYRQNFEKSFYQRCGYSILYIIIRRRQYYRVAGNLRFICCKLLGKSSSLK